MNKLYLCTLTDPYSSRVAESEGKIATADDSAEMESLFALLQKNVLDHRR